MHQTHPHSPPWPSIAPLRKFGRPPRARQPRRGRNRSPSARWTPSVFNCPSCARPLAHGANVCPGCGTRLIVGVRARARDRRSWSSASIAGTHAGRRRDDRRRWSSGPRLASHGRPATAAAGRTPAPASGRERRAGPPGRCRRSRRRPYSALRQAAIVNGRLAGYAAELDRALAAKSTKGIDIARILRAVSADVMFGLAIAPSDRRRGPRRPTCRPTSSAFYVEGPRLRPGQPQGVRLERARLQGGRQAHGQAPLGAAGPRGPVRRDRRRRRPRSARALAGSLRGGRRRRSRSARRTPRRRAGRRRASPTRPASPPSR